VAKDEARSSDSSRPSETGTAAKSVCQWATCGNLPIKSTFIHFRCEETPGSPHRPRSLPPNFRPCAASWSSKGLGGLKWHEVEDEIDTDVSSAASSLLLSSDEEDQLCDTSTASPAAGASTLDKLRSVGDSVIADLQLHGKTFGRASPMQRVGRSRRPPLVAPPFHPMSADSIPAMSPAYPGLNERFSNCQLQLSHWPMSDVAACSSAFASTYSCMSDSAYFPSMVLY